MGRDKRRGWSGHRAALRAMPAPPGGWPEHDELDASWLAAGVDPSVVLEADELAVPTAGTVLTPPVLAHLVAARLLAHATVGRSDVLAVDPATGSGSLLLALGARLGWGGARLVGADLDPHMVQRARATFAEVPACGDPVLRVADALTDPWDGIMGLADLVIANPPFLPEKGNAEIFRALAEHPRWRARMRPRVDLQYMFLHLALDLLVDGGVFGLITTAYWPTATGADRLRADLMARAQVLEIVDLGALRPFEQARGHHTLLVFGRRASHDVGPLFARGGGAALVRTVIAPREEAYPQLCSPGEGDGSDGTIQTNEWAGPQSAAAWHIHISRPIAEALAALDAVGVPLPDLFEDRQGVVSGLDRDVNGDGVFLLSADEASTLVAAGVDPAILPRLLRGSAVRPFATQESAPGSDHLVLLRGDEEQVHERLLAHLAPHRARLELRREVRNGVRPWWALQWPRGPRMLGEPKLVCARRAAHAAFALEPGAAAVSSDCTWLVPAQSISQRTLKALHLLINSSCVDLQLQHRGKRKGNLIELYAAPLRAVRVPLLTPTLADALDQLSKEHDLDHPLDVDMAIVRASLPPSQARSRVEEHVLERWTR